MDALYPNDKIADATEEKSYLENYIMDCCNDPIELAHDGILGMKWGQRRYQNSDGSYTDEGLERKRAARQALNDSKEEYKILKKKARQEEKNESIRRRMELNKLSSEQKLEEEKRAMIRSAEEKQRREEGEAKRREAELALEREKLEAAEKAKQDAATKAQRMKEASKTRQQKAAELLMKKDEMDYKTLKDAMDRIELEEKLKNMTNEEKRQAKDYVGSLLKKSGSTILEKVVPSVTMYLIQKAITNSFDVDAEEIFGKNKDGQKNKK